MRRAVHALITIVVVLGPRFTMSTAHADSFAVPASADARTHLKLGNKLYRIRSFEETIVEYKAGALIEAPGRSIHPSTCDRPAANRSERKAIQHLFIAINQRALVLPSDPQAPPLRFELQPL